MQSASYSFDLIEIKGQDAANFLQARTTNDVLTLKSGCGQLSCLLDRKAHVLALFSLHKLEDCYWIVAEHDQINSIIDELNKYLFNEKVEIISQAKTGRLLTAQGLAARKFLLKMLGDELIAQLSDYDIASIKLWDFSIGLIKRSLAGVEGYLFFVNSADADKFEICLHMELEKLGISFLTSKSLETLRIESGIPCYGIDVTAKNLLPEAGLVEQVVSYIKGCYLGQEVITRIKSFGAPKQGLIGLQFALNERHSFAIDSPIICDGQAIGSIKSNTYSSLLQRTIAFAYLNKEYRIPNKNLSVEIAHAKYQVQVIVLPFKSVLSIKEQAQKMYEEALSEFTQADEKHAINLLQDALMLDPLNADCYEMLGVILAKHNELDQAIELMKKLSKLDSNSVMAHANLSVFYMQKGDKQAAEEEKAIAMSLRMQQIAKQAIEEQQQDKAEEQKRQEAKQRLEMFKQVLLIDSEDLLANYGIGNIYVELKEYEQAVPYLQKAIAVKPTHTVAYLALGSAYQGLRQITNACDTYQQGIKVATQKGDMMPLKEMQMRLAQLENNAKTSLENKDH